LDAALFAAPAVVVMLRDGARRHWTLAPLIVLGAVPLLALLLLYYRQITGHPFVLPQTLRDAGDGLLGPKWRIVQSTEILVGRFVELAEWVSPLFVLAFAWAFVLKLRGRALRFYDLYGPLFLIGYWFYWSDGGLRWGARYIYPAFPFMALLVADATWRALQKPTTRVLLLAHLVAASTLVSALQVPFLAARAYQIVSTIQDIFTQVRRADLHNAVVVAAASTGTIWRLFPGDLARNDLNFDADVIYAHSPGLLSKQVTQGELERTVRDLHAYYPTRPIWIYLRQADAREGRLVQAAPGPMP
jgi:hypothetical protein